LLFINIISYLYEPNNTICDKCCDLNSICCIINEIIKTITREQHIQIKICNPFLFNILNKGSVFLVELLIELSKIYNILYTYFVNNCKWNIYINNRYSNTTVDNIDALKSINGIGSYIRENKKCISND